VTVEGRERALELSSEGSKAELVDAALLRRTGGDAGSVRLSRSDVEGWRLVIPADRFHEVEHQVGKEVRYGRWIDRIGLAPAILALASISAAVVVVGHFAPRAIAPLIPYAWERNMGDAIVGDFGDNRCRSAEGQQALEAMVERLAPGSTRGEDPIRIAALDVSIFNAAALPGGHIVVFKTAITDTRDADELAGIVAHEIAHVRRRHVTEALVRELGIGALIRLFAGNVGASADELVALSYTRANEAEADADAIAMLDRAGISPIPTARLFHRLARDDGEGASYAAQFLQSHPQSADRARRFASSFNRGKSYSPILSQEQSDALFNVCLKRPATN
jgi:predicted Zn-dependent protease